MTRSVDVAIVGQGLAGTTLAWALIDRGAEIAIIDQELTGAASRVAGGLITPLTGKKIKPEPDFDTLWIAAKQHYQHVGKRLQEDFLMLRPATRRLDSTALADAWKLADAERSRYAENSSAPPGIKSDDMAFISMPVAARLDTQRYLAASRAKFVEAGLLIEGIINDDSITVEADKVSIESPAIVATQVVFCRGWRDSLNQWFDTVQWRPAKGQILTLRIPGFSNEHTIYANGIWLTHQKDDVFLCGATYSWSGFDQGPEPDQTDHLLEKLDALLTVEYTVEHIASGTRPIVSGRQPIIGFSHHSKRVGIMNGLGSKGSLYVPYIATMMANALTQHRALDARFDVQARFPTS